MSITRREFGKSTAGAGLLYALGARTRDTSAAIYGPEIAARTFHFDLSHYEPFVKHFLHAGGRSYFLEPHTVATRLAARRDRLGLVGVADAHLTHFSTNVVVSNTHMQRIHVRSSHPTRRHGLSLVAMHIPIAARIRARLARNLGAPPGQGTSGTDCLQYDQFPDDYLTGRSTAKAVILHHPDLCNLDPDTAAAIETHMDYDQAAAVDNLTLSICLQGPAFEHDPAFLDGWAVLVPMQNDDGTPLVDMTGAQIYDYQFSAQTGIDIQPAIEALLAAVKQDQSLDGEQYEVIYHGDPVDESSLPPESPPILNSDETTAFARSAIGARLAMRGGSPKDAGANVTFSSLGYHHNVLFYKQSAAADGRSFTLSMLNLNYIWYGVYLEYLDPNGVPLSSGDRSSFLNELIANNIDLETNTLKFWDLMSPPAAVFGLPIPTPYKISVNLPAGCSQVRISLIGPGAYGHLPYGPAVIPGTVLSFVCGYVIPTYFMANGAGLDENKTMLDLFTQKGTIIKTLLLYSQEYNLISGTQTNDLGVVGSLESVLASMLQDALLLNIKSSVPELWAWMTGKKAEEEAEESVPFVGWVIRIMALLGSAASMATTSAEIATNPLVISNTISFTNSVTVVVSHDPTDFEFPLTAARFQVQITVGDKAIEPPTVVQITNEDRSNDTLTAIVDNIPTTGAPATVSVVFLTNTNYPIAHSCVVNANGVPVLDDDGNRIAGDITFMNRLPANGGPLVVNVPIVENPVPITSTTQYTHHHKLAYANGRYLWNYTSVPPALEAPSCDTASGLCDLGTVSIWLPGGMIGYSWVASSTSIRSCRSGASGQLYNFQNVSLKNDPNAALKHPGCGFPAPTPIAYDTNVLVGQTGHNFYLDPVSISDSDPEYLLRAIVLDNTTPIQVNTNQSWGRFRIEIDRMAVYGSGQPPRVVGISTRNHKFAVLELPDAPYIGDDYANNAKVMSGPGETNDSLVSNPIALTIASNGAILILQGNANKRVKAFDFDGKPWKFFSGASSSVLPLTQDATSVIWLDIAIDATNLLYVLSYTGSGLQMADYRLDIYDTSTGQRIVRNTGIGVARIVVDKFRGLYSLNRETIKGSPMVEPSVSVWAPSTPPG